MSPNKRRVISLALRYDHEDEGEILRMIEAGEKAGYDVKQIIIPKLLKMMGKEIKSTDYMKHQINDFLVTIDELKTIVNDLKQAGIYRPPADPQPEPPAGETDISADDPLIQSLMKRRKGH